MGLNWVCDRNVHLSTVGKEGSKWTWRLVGGAEGGVLGGCWTGDLSGCRFRRMSVRERSVEDSLSVSGASGEPGDGWFSAWTMSWAAAIRRSTDDAVGIGMCSGNQVTVSGVRSRCVSQIQIR